MPEHVRTQKSARQELDESVPEKALQADVIKLAQTMNWRVYHTFDSRRSAYGFPDLVLVRTSNVGGRIIFAELKTERGKTSPSQDEWLRDLRATGKAEVYLWRPSDWSSGWIERVLR